jgi:hypothetical protein
MLDLDCHVTPDGGSIILKLPDRNGATCELVLTFEEASSLAMTLPRLLTAALRQRYSDDALRHVYPLRAYAVERASDYRHLLVTLAAADGFDVVFAVNLEAAAAFAIDLVSSGGSLATAKPMLQN